ncbi:GNAT family N-acetyltransferase [Halorhabdus rudnickae]|uniref:GNAT family N-acetyltransferase n=1 Tax=Halorhabdus rudnickae TaxID=1775544 RepID=UPI0010845997|nr:N-acetyltransferase [Halorhabdus rudnickae]
MTPEVTIDVATPEDRPRLRAIQRAVLAEPSPDLLAVAVDGAGLALVARVDQPAQTDDPVGYALALTADEITYIPELAVTPAWQRQGIGTVLIERTAERATADGVTEIRLTVRADDDAARAFYRDCGFEVLEELPDHYETGSGAGLLLRRRL